MDLSLRYQSFAIYSLLSFWWDHGNNFCDKKCTVCTFTTFFAFMKCCTQYSWNRLALPASLFWVLVIHHGVQLWCNADPDYWSSSGTTEQQLIHSSQVPGSILISNAIEVAFVCSPCDSANSLVLWFPLSSQRCTLISCCELCLKQMAGRRNSVKLMGQVERKRLSANMDSNGRLWWTCQPALSEGDKGLQQRRVSFKGQTLILNICDGNGWVKRQWVKI